MKKVMSLFLSLAMAFLLITVSTPVAFAAEYTGACGNSVVWNLDTFTGELVISGNGDMKDYSADSVPSWSTYQNYIKTVTIGDGITSVGAYAFYNITGYKYPKMSTVNLSGSVAAIDEYAFRGCKSITSFNGMDGVTQIGEYAFRSCSGLTSVDLGSSLVSLGNGAFSLCSGLADISFPSTLKTIGPSAFSGCSSLESLTIPSTVTSLGNLAFADCTGLTSVLFSASSVTGQTYGVFNGAGAQSGMNVTFGDNVTVVPAGLFENCPNINAVTLGSAVATVDNFAFYSSGVRSVYVPASVTAIGYNAFSLCNRLTAFTVDGENTSFSVGENGELLNKTKTYLYRYPSGRGATSYTVPSTVRMINAGAFSGDNTLASVDTANVVIVNDYAFAMCSSLCSISMPMVTSVKNYAFSDCDILTDVEAPKLTTVGDYSFFGCDGLVDLSGFTALTTINKYAFSNIEGFNTLSIPSTVTSIGDYAFNNCDKLTALTVPSSVKSIHEGAFSNCENLSNVTLSEGITTVYQYAFLNCPALTSITIPASVTSIGSVAFGYKQSGSSYAAISGFKIYCYSGTAGYTYAYNHQSRLSYEIVTDGIEEDIIAPDSTVEQPAESLDVFGMILLIIEKLFSFIKNLI